MFLPGWSAWCVLLTLHMSACGLEISGYESEEVICSQGLSDCTMKDEVSLSEPKNTVDVQNIKPDFKLCCEDRTTCTLCLVIETEIYIHPEKAVEDEGHSGSEEEDNSDETSNPKASVMVCYKIAATLPTCKKVEFTVNHAALAQHNQTKIAMVIMKPDGFPFSSQMYVYPPKSIHLMREFIAPSLYEVCSKELQKRVPKCYAPTISTVINQEKNQVELLFKGRNKTLPSVCVQYEEEGNCQSWNRSTIPLYSVTPCTCLQVWDDDERTSVRTQHCPFNKTNVLHVVQKNIWENVSVSVRPGKMTDYSTMLSWNLSAPCRLEGEVCLSHRGNGCRETNTFRQQLKKDTWKQNSKGHWEKTGVFENINLQLTPCVMVKVKGAQHELGPFCFENTGRWRWSLLVVGVMLLVCLTALMFYLLHDLVKKWVWSWNNGGLVQIDRTGHVVLLSPPDMYDGVLESVCQLGSFLRDQGFSVSVDQWSRKEQCTLGPLPWLHSQLLRLNSHGGRVLLVLTDKALEKTEEWTHRDEDGVMKRGDKDLPLSSSPYSDMFTASLFIIQADKQLGRAGERFLLLKFDSHPLQSHSSDRTLPVVLQGLPLFQLPSQTQALLDELGVVETEKGPGRMTWTEWSLGSSDGWRI
ncbi:interleukin-17 receptor C [Brachyistius frenatus]|uniref:interleukin-17 receptor C n=1 Tax=Brachyistius frenatus TaxID=100188 RepID=UPI0037E874BC